MEEPRSIGDWTRISVLGSGGFGTVVLWRCSKSNDAIAVKKCKLRCATSLTAKHKERWRKEVQIMKELDHPNIIKYKQLPIDLEEELNKYNPTNLPLLPMEYCQKGNLRHILTQPVNQCGLKEATIKNILLDITSAVSYLHNQNITHRDIKPENIVLNDCPLREDNVMYKLIDLGYAKELGDSTVSFVGTLYYLAPEILANRIYNCSVDYWSLGILTFEIICGVLPFAPFLSPVERFQVIKGKGSDSICIYRSNMGNIQYSSELFKENQVTSCFKGHLEVWLRKVLQYDPALRMTPFSNSNQNIFDQMKMILRKRIVTVFIVHNYEFYSYEYDECTRLATVQQWIARDTKISEKEQLLLGSEQYKYYDEQTLLVDCLTDNKSQIYVFKRGCLFNKDRHHVPRLVKFMFEKATEKFAWNEIKGMYSHSIHYVSHDLEHATAFSKAIDLYMEHLKSQTLQVMNNAHACRAKVVDLLAKVADFNQTMKKKSGSNKTLVTFVKFSELCSAIEKCIKDEYYLSLHVEKWLIKLNVMFSMSAEVDVIKIPQLKELLENAVQLLQKTADTSDKKNKIFTTVQMLKIVCNVMKLKEKLLTDVNLNQFVCYLGKATEHMMSLLEWINSFDFYVKQLSYSLIDLQKELLTITQTEGDALQNSNCAILYSPKEMSALKEMSDRLASRYNGDLSESEELFNKAFNSFKEFCDELDFYMSDVSALL